MSESIAYFKKLPSAKENSLYSIVYSSTVTSLMYIHINVFFNINNPFEKHDLLEVDEIVLMTSIQRFSEVVLSCL